MSKRYTMKKWNYILPIVLVAFSVESCSVGVATIKVSEDGKITSTGTVSRKEFLQQMRKDELEQYKELNASYIWSSYREQAYKAYRNLTDSLSSQNNTENIGDHSLTTAYTDNTEGLVTENTTEENIHSFRRSSLYTLIIGDESNDYYYHVKNVFSKEKIPTKFNDHNIGPYEIPGKAGGEHQPQNIENYLNKNHVAKQLISKWFNRDRNGAFNIDLVARRGEYNASELDVKTALHSMRGKALLRDAGEELIGNTFVIVYDFADIDNERDNRMFSKSSGGVKSNIKVKAYLYRLVWDDEMAALFYENYWMDKSNIDPDRKQAFDQSDSFNMKYIGHISSSESSAIGSIEHSKNIIKEIEAGNLMGISLNHDENAIKLALTTCINDLERKYEEFRTKFPLYSGNPITAKVGTKEGIRKGDKFEVLERVLLDNGASQYKRLGTVTVAKDEDVWNNSSLDDWFNPSASDQEYTIFQGTKGRYQPGMLIRYIK